MTSRILLFSITLVLSLSTLLIADSNLTSAEETAGRESISRFSKMVAEGTKEDKRLYELLTKNKEFFAIWSRSIADKDDAKKLKALIKACRKEKLWTNVEWMLDALSEFEDESPAFYRLQALSRYEQGDIKLAKDTANRGVERHIWHRGLRRLWYKLYCEVELPHPQPKVSTLKELKYVVDVELCHERTDFLRASFNSIEGPQDVPNATMYTTSSEILVDVFQDYLGDKGKLPITYQRDHSCRYIVGPHPEEPSLFLVVCKTHGRYGVVRKIDGKPLTGGKLCIHSVSDAVLYEAINESEGIYAVKAAENLLLRKDRISPEDEEQVLKLIQRTSLNELELVVLMRAILHYTRRYSLCPNFERAIIELTNRTKGPVCALGIIILRWCGKNTNSFSDDELAALAGGYCRVLYKLHDYDTDIRNFVYEYLKRDKEKALARLERIQKTHISVDRGYAPWLRDYLKWQNSLGH